MTVASSVVLMTDTYYVLNNGPVAGVLIFLLSLSLAFYTTVRDQLSSVVAVGLWMLVLLAIHLVWDPTNHPNDAGLQFGSSTERVQIPEGLYYFDKNEWIQSVVDHWPEHYRTYSWATSTASTVSSTSTGSTTTVVGATPWMPSGDSRTGLPFLIHHWPEPNWHRVFLRTLNEKDDESEEEYIALDIAFPPGNTTTTTTTTTTISSKQVIFTLLQKRHAQLQKAATTTTTMTNREKKKRKLTKKQKQLLECKRRLYDGS